MTSVETAPTQGNRRKHRRYQIDLPMSFRQVWRKRTVADGSGLVVNISSGGVLFTTAAPPPVGSTVELCLQWPFRTDTGAPLQLLVVGRVVRSHEGSVAVKMVRHDLKAVAVG